LSKSKESPNTCSYPGFRETIWFWFQLVS
jgi:hypothetical protein